VGAYGDAVTAGCDTIRDVVQVFDYIQDQHEAGKDILYEGLFVMNMTRGPELVARVDTEVFVLQLTVTLATCIAGIDSRREVRGAKALFNKKNTKGNYVRAVNYCDVMRGAGATVVRARREEALKVLLGLLNL